ncbi:hypothetical protein F5X97DRAFT_316541 [Nemania serpens]|nr:hypothetical protein F5X97DRAFT_316541 [Nemania serpens]
MTRLYEVTYLTYDSVISPILPCLRGIWLRQRPETLLCYSERELQRVLIEGEDVYQRKVIRRVASTVRREGRAKGEIKELLGGTGA